MFDSFALNQDSFISSQKTFAAYERQQQLYNPSRIHEGFLLRTGQVLSGQKKIIDFAGIPFEFRLMSVWIGINSGDFDATTIKVMFRQGEQTRFNLSKNEIPWMPPFNILGSEHSLEVTPNGADIESISIFIQPAKLLDVETV